MVHLPQLIQDLGLILVTAAIVTILFKKLKQPVVLGYLIAGFLLGPNVSFMPTVKDTTEVQIWAEIGVIILLFGLGLEFSFKKLSKVGRSATITSVFEVTFMLAAGYISGSLLGWSSMDSLFLGGILSISSTTIIVRAFDELGLKSRRFVSLVFGVLIVEDIVAILLLVLLSTVAISQSLSGSELITSGAKLGFFLILWFVLGIYLLPPFMNRIRHLLSDETVLVVALGLCLLMVIIATNVGFSPALGAFMMGSLLSETKDGERIEKLIHPVRDLFAAIFFVSVGMLINPGIVVEYRYEIIFITIITIVGKFLSSMLGSLISGTSLRHSVQVGMSLAQIGEFSFIIATLGLKLKVTSPFLYPIAVAVSAITTFTTPYLIKSADPLCRWLEKILPKGAQDFIEKYQSAIQSEGVRSGIASLLWKAIGWRILVNTIIVTAIFLFVEKIAHKWVVEIIGTVFLSSLLLTLGALAAAGPFLWAICFGESRVKLSEEEQVRVDRLSFGVLLARAFFTLNIVALFINGFISINSLAGIAIFLVMSLLLAAGHQLSYKVYNKFEDRFIENLKGEYKVKSNEVVQIPQLAPWDVGLVEFMVHPNSKLVGLSLLNAKLRESFGVTVALAHRGDANFIAPTRDWIIMPFDKLFIIGTDDQLEKVRHELEQKSKQLDTSTHELFGLRSIRLTSLLKLDGLAIQTSGIRNAIAGVIVGIERGGERILSPESNMVLKNDDLLWVVGDIERIKALAEGKEL
jgi:monovalent cation:H+ antiporter-2, CPA2 family